MGRVRAASLVFAALAVGLLLAACGGGGDAELLPGATADQITSNLDQVRVSYEEGNCEGAEDGVAEVSTEVAELGSVDAKLKKALQQGAAKLSEVVSTCRAQEEEQEQAAEEATEEEEQAQLEAEELAEEEAFEKEQKAEEREEKKTAAQEKAEEHAEQPGPSEGSKGPHGKAKGHEKQEESVEPPVEGEEEVTPPSGGPAGGIGPGAAVESGDEG